MIRIDYTFIASMMEHEFQKLKLEHPKRKKDFERGVLKSGKYMKFAILVGEGSRLAYCFFFVFTNIMLFFTILPNLFCTRFGFSDFH